MKRLVVLAAVIGLALTPAAMAQQDSGAAPKPI